MQYKEPCRGSFGAAGLLGIPTPGGDMFVSRRKRLRAQRDAAFGLPTALDGSDWRAAEPLLCDRSNDLMKPCLMKPPA